MVALLVFGILKMCLPLCKCARGFCDIFSCFLSPFGKEACTSCIDKLGHGAGGFVNYTSKSGDLLGC